MSKVGRVKSSIDNTEELLLQNRFTVMILVNKDRDKTKMDKELVKLVREAMRLEMQKTILNNVLFKLLTVMTT